MTPIKLFLSTLISILLIGCASVKTVMPAADVAPSANAISPLSLKLYIFECGRNDVSDLSMFAPGIGPGIKKRLTVSCYLIVHPKGMLLWDSGLSDELAGKPDGISVMNGKFHLIVKKPFLKQLAEIGVKPNDINYLAFSHFHSDHVGNANAFTKGTLLIQKEEYDAAFGEEPTKFGFSPQVYGHLKNNPTKVLNGDYDVFKDGSVVIKKAPGHTPGHQVLFIDLPKTGPILLSGDLYHFTDNRIHKRVPIFNFNKIQTEQSMAKIENFVKETKAVMWIQHDYEQNQTLHHAPAFYE